MNGRQVRRLHALQSLVGAIDAGNQQAAGQQRSLDRILRLAGQEHLLGVMYQRAEETCQRGAAIRHGQIHLRGKGFGLSLDRCRESEVAHQPVHQQHGAAQPVAMLVVVGNRIGHQGPHLFDGGKHVGEGGTSRRYGGAAAQRRFDQGLRPQSLPMRLPEAVAAIGLQPLDTGFAALAPLHHALDGFQAVEIVAGHATVTDGDSFADGAPSGNSTDGIRQVTARLDPP